MYNSWIGYNVEALLVIVPKGKVSDEWETKPYITLIPVILI